MEGRTESEKTKREKEDKGEKGTIQAEDRKEIKSTIEGGKG